MRYLDYANAWTINKLKEHGILFKDTYDKSEAYSVYPIKGLKREGNYFILSAKALKRMTSRDIIDSLNDYLLNILNTLENGK